MTKKLLALPAALILTVLVLAGCSGNDEGGDSMTSESVTSDSGGAAEAESASDTNLTQPASAPDAQARKGAAQAEAAVYQADRQVIRTGVVSLVSDDVAAARREVQKILDLHRGFVTDEETSADGGDGVANARLVLRVPAADFTEVMGKLEKIADLETSTIATEDVTGQVVDNDARIRAQEIGLRRIEHLLDRATAMPSILRIESEITRRQADLDSLKQQRAHFEDQTTMATVTVHITETYKELRADEKEDGFAAGFKGGWHALADTAVALATVGGALLPWAVVLALVGFPLWLFVRRVVRVSRRLQPSPASTPGQTPSAC